MSPTRSAQPRVTYLVKRLELAVRARLDTVTGVLGLTTPQYAALSVLRITPGLSSAELARRSFVSAQAMNEMVTILQKKNLVSRTAAPDHKKVLRISLTPLGQDTLDACDADVDAVESQMLADLTPHDVQTLVTALHRCCEALSAQPP